MCGLCVESHLMELLGEESSKNAPVSAEHLNVGLLIEPYTQESNFLMHALKYARDLEMENQALYVLHCRALEEIALRPDSAMDSSLALMVLVKHYHSYQRFAVSTFKPDSIADLLPHTDWKLIFDPDFIFAKKQWPAFLEGPELLQQSRVLLEEYCLWWLDGENQEKNDLEQNLAETGVMDPIEDIASTQWDKFYSLFPAHYFALVCLSRHDPGSSVIQRIALSDTNGVPDFPGYDLWLKRKALLYAVQANGDDFLLDNAGINLSLDLVYYAFLKLDLVRQHKQKLIDRIRDLSKGELKKRYLQDEIDSYVEKISGHRQAEIFQ